MITFAILAAVLALASVLAVTLPLLRRAKSGTPPAPWAALTAGAVLLVGSALLYLAWSHWSWRAAPAQDSPQTMVARLAPVYEKTTLTYRNLGQNGVQSLSVRAILVTRNYTSKSKHDQLQMIHDKLADAVGDIRETRGTHPKWAEIDPAATTDKWPMYLTAK